MDFEQFSIQLIDKHCKFYASQIVAIQEGLRDIDEGRSISLSEVKSQWNIE